MKYILSVFSVLFLFSTVNASELIKSVNIRKMPDNESSVLGSLSKGHKVVVVGYENQWYKIHWNQNNYGYIHESFLSVTEKDKKFKEDNTVVMTEKVSSSLKTPYEFSCPVVTN